MTDIQLLSESNLVLSDTVGSVSTSLISAPLGATLVAMCFTETASASFALSTSRTLGVVWTPCVISDAASGKAAIYTAPMVQDSPGTLFRCVLDTGTDDAALKVFIFGGVDLNLPVPYSATRSSTLTNYTPSFVSHRNGSWFVGAGTEYSGGGACTSDDDGEGFDAASDMSGLAVLKLAPTPVIGSTVTLNFRSPAASPNWAIVVAELAPAASPPKILVPGRAVEDDTALPVTGRKVPVARQAAEVDEARPIQPVKVRALGQPSDVSTAQPVRRSLTWTVGQAVEDDTALRVGRDAKVRPAEETDTAAPIRAAKSRLLGRAADTSTTRPIGRIKTRALGRPTDTSSARPIFRLVSRDLQQAVEVESALPIVRGPALVRVVGQAVETDTASRLHYQSAPLAITGIYRGWQVKRLRRTWSAGSPST